MVLVETENMITSGVGGEKRGRGRPRLGNVLYARRVSPEKVEELEAVRLGQPRTGAGGGSVVEKVVVKEVVREVGGEEVERLRKINMALADNVAGLEGQVKDLTARLERCSRATDDEKCRWWMMKYDRLLAETKGGGEYDQTRG